MEADYLVMKRFIKAIEFNHILEVEELLKNNKIDLNCEIWGKNVSINKYNKVDLKDSGYTALLIAAKCNSPEIIKIILKYKYININKKANDEYTALMIACKYNHIEVVNELLKHPYINIEKVAYLDIKSRFKKLKRRRYSDCETAFSIAVNKNNIEIVELLAKHPDLIKEKRLH